MNIDAHSQWMQRALSLADKARLLAPPNPWVGCVIVKEGQIVGEGHTQPPGQAHAEICALQQAQENAKGATVYVTLEPCAHFGRTSPCTEALIQAGIRTVYVGIQDPDPRIQGRGIVLLQQAGIQVFQGLHAQQIEQALAPYLYQRQTGLPYTILKAAISVDGCIAAADHTSQWITTPEAREDAHVQRAASQAIVIGAGTALKDSPRLTVRHSSLACVHPPLRVLLDAKGRVPAIGPLFDAQLAPTLIMTTSQATKEQIHQWEKAGAEVIVIQSAPTGVDLQEAWKHLGNRGILQVLVEGGAMLHNSLLDTSLVNRLLIYIGPLLLGSTGLSFYQKSIPTLQCARRLKLHEVRKIGESVRLDYQPILQNNKE